MKILKRLFLLLMMTNCTLGLHAQVPGTPVDSLNTYQELIHTIQQLGFNISDFLDEEGFAKELSKQGYSVDSLRYYYLNNIQDDPNTVLTETPALALVSKIYPDSIVLRWAPSAAFLWQQLSKKGYSLMRVEAIQDERGLIKGVDSTTLIQLVDTLNPILPWPYEELSNRLKDTDTLALIAAQGLYGQTDSAQVSTLDYVQRNKERQIYFGFALMAADRSTLAAELLGLRFVDETAQPGKAYFYYLSSSYFGKEVASFTLVRNEVNLNRRIEGLRGFNQDQTISLIWPREKNKFSGYWIERSADNGNNWKRCTDELLVFLESPGPKKPFLDVFADRPTETIDINYLDLSDYYVFTDSTVNNVNYIYRVKGQTSFADFTDYASVSVVSEDLTPPPAPIIITHEVDEGTDIGKIGWRIDGSSETLKDLAGFTVWEAPHPDSTFYQLSGSLGPSSRSYQTPQGLEKERSHYLMVKAEDEQGNVSASFPVYLHVIDDIPPATPRRPSAMIDSSGVVTLVWDHNTEADFLGYRVYYSNSLRNEFTQATRDLLTTNLFMDTIEVRTLTENIYYKIVAVDKSYNLSPFTKAIEVQKPDIIPPVSPVLHRPEMNDTLILLSWTPSTSMDVEAHLLYRRKYRSGDEWEVLERLSASDSSYTDRTAEIEQFYEYTLRAQDDAGLLSEMAFPVKARRWFGEAIPGIENLQLRYDSIAQSVELSWQYQPIQQAFLQNEDYRFYIYRSVGNTSLIRYRIVETNERTFTDIRLPTTDRYTYAVKLVYLNGKSSRLSAAQSVSVKLE